MKLFKNIMLMATVALFAACDTDVDTPQLNSPENFVTPVMGACNDVIVNLDNSKAENVIFTWSAADFGLPVQVLYSLYITDGTSQGLVGMTSTTSYSISKGDLNGVAVNALGIPANSTASISAFVTAEVNGETDYEPLKSANSNSFNISTFAQALKNLYVVGFFNGWSADAAVEIWETAGGTNVYAGMYNFIEDATNTPGYSGWKVLDERSWNGGNWGYDAFKAIGSTITSSTDGNLVLPAGIWEISVNPLLMSVDASKVGTTLGLIGDFNSWGADAFFTYDAVENVWKTEPVTLEAGSGIKIRVNSAWELNWGTEGGSSTAISGGIELVKGADNISVPASGTYVAVLHSDRTPYVLELVAQ